MNTRFSYRRRRIGYSNRYLSTVCFKLNGFIDDDDDSEEFYVECFISVGTWWSARYQFRGRRKLRKPSQHIRFSSLSAMLWNVFRSTDSAKSASWRHDTALNGILSQETELKWAWLLSNQILTIPEISQDFGLLDN